MIARSLWSDAVLALVATAVASWPVQALVDGTDWVWCMLAGLTAVMLTGIVARALRTPASLVLLVQLMAGWTVLGWLFMPRRLFLGMPLGDAFERAAELTRLGAVTIRTESVPAPETAGLSFIVAAAMVAIGWSVDALAVTLRSPALAGLPLFLVLVVSASGTGEPLHPVYFLMAATAWLILLARQTLGAVRAWTSRRRGTDLTMRAAPREHPTSGHRRWATGLGVVGVVLAIAVAGAVPHLEPRAVLRGVGNAPTTAPLVRFTETLDLSDDLADRSGRTVLTYRSDDAQTTPLRVLATHRFQNGRWWPVMGEDAPASVPPDVIERDDVALEAREITVVENGLGAPQVAIPYPLASADFGDIEWRVDERTGTVRVDARPESYSATFTEVSGRLPAGVGAGPASFSFENDLLRVAPASQDLVNQVVDEVLAEAGPDVAGNQLLAARAIQSYLRGSDFTYSLTLADPEPIEAVEATDSQGEQAELTDPHADPVTHFLITRVGYCTHFATAMVMMARSVGIPARLALGFLPGDRAVDGSYTVTAADAHAWPELYITGLGWIRFEPTPAVRAGSAPVYLAPVDVPDTGPVTEAPTEPGAEQLPDDPMVEPVSAEVPPTTWQDDVARFAPSFLIALAVVVLGLLVVPTAGRRRRGAARRRATDEAGRIEGEWQLLVLSLADLGVRAPVGATPRRAGDEFVQAGKLTGDAAAAAERAVTRVERTRYAPRTADDDEFAEQRRALTKDVASVIRAARARLTRRERVRIALWPESGRAELRALADRAGATLRALDISQRRVRRG